MDRSSHTMNALFEQLGLPSDNSSIDQFIRTHILFSQEIELEEATFWDENQARFLKQCRKSDSDWSEVVDELNIRLHS